MIGAPFGSEVVQKKSPTSPSLQHSANSAKNPNLKPCRCIIAVGGGKGGIGKSLLSSNLALSLAQSGQEVILLDADLGGANLHTCLGIAPPQKTLSDFVQRKTLHLADLLTPTPYPQLSLVSGALDAFSAAHPKYTDKVRLFQEIGRLKSDYIVIDLGAGTGLHIVDFFLVADKGIVTVIPEPTSVENAYRFIKTVCFRLLKSYEGSLGLSSYLQEKITEMIHNGAKSPLEVVRLVAQKDRMMAEKMQRLLLKQPLYLVVNQVRTTDEVNLGPKMVQACQKYFGVSLKYLGHIVHDEAVWQAVRQKRPVLDRSPQSIVGQQIRDIARGLVEAVA